MANAREGNVIYCDTDDSTFADAKNICGIKYIGAASSSITIKAGSSSGNSLWEESASTNVFNEVCIHSPDGIHITVGGTATVYIYLK
jgi:hypothetical protein